MTRNQAGGISLIAGSLAGLLTMSLHPTGSDVAQNAAGGGHNVLAVGVHALAIAAIPVLLTGALVLTLRLARSRDLAWTALIVYATGSVAIMIAAVASGLIATDLAHSYARAAAAVDAAARESLQTQMHLAGVINQAFAKVFVMCSAVAIMLWSATMLRTRVFGKALVTLGFVSGTAMVIGVASGHLQLNIHGFGAVIVAQGIWMCWSGMVLMRIPDGPTV